MNVQLLTYVNRTLLAMLTWGWYCASGSSTCSENKCAIKLLLCDLLLSAYFTESAFRVFHRLNLHCTSSLRKLEEIFFFLSRFTNIKHFIPNMYVCLLGIKPKWNQQIFQASKNEKQYFAWLSVHNCGVTPLITLLE